MTRGPILLAAIILIGGCDDDDEDNGIDMRTVPTADMAVPQGAQTRTATLSGAEEVPPVSTAYNGTSTATINAAQSEIAVVVNHNIPIANTTAAHIHIGARGVAGPVIFTLAAGSVPSALTRTLTASELEPKPGAMTFTEAVNAILAGQTYVNIHSMTYPNGEIRGQLE